MMIYCNGVVNTMQFRREDWAWDGPHVDTNLAGLSISTYCIVLLAKPAQASQPISSGLFSHDNRLNNNY